MKNIFLLTALAAAILTINTASAQITSKAPQDSTFWFMDRKDFATYTTALWSTGAVFMEFQWWWRDDYIYKEHKFRLINDGYFNNYSLGVDKMGHMFTSYLIFHTTHDFLKWAGYDDRTAMWSSIAVPFAHALAIEIADGFSKYAFSPADLLFNSSGIAYAALQTEYPFMNNFKLKWSYFPSANRGRDDPDWGPASDYSGHIYWLSMDMHNLLPEDAKPYWPKFLNLAVGYGANNVSFDDQGPKLRKFAVALDWKMTELPLEGDTWEVLKNIIDKVHFPAPGLRYVEGGKPQFKPLLLN